MPDFIALLLFITNPNADSGFNHKFILLLKLNTSQYING